MLTMATDTSPAAALSTDLFKKDLWVLRVLGMRIPRSAPTADQRRNAVRELIQTILADLPALSASDPDAATRARTAFDTGTAAARNGDLDSALRVLSDCTETIARATADARAREAAAAVPEGTVERAVRAIEIARARWNAARLGSVEGMTMLVNALRQEDDPDLLEIADRIEAITTTLPSELDAALTELQDGFEHQDEAAVAIARSRIGSLISENHAFIGEHVTELLNCEENPWGVSVSVIAPIGDAIAGIEAGLKAI